VSERQGSEVADRLRERSARALDDLAFVKWRVGGVVVAVVVCALVYFFMRSGSYVPSPEAVEAARMNAPTSLTTVTTPAPAVVVNAAGAVREPGLYTLEPDARVADAVEAAGGLAGDADLDRVNLAAKVADGERVYVPRRGQPLPEVIAGGGLSGSAGVSGQSGTSLVDLNTATAEQLDALPGVGPATAQAILQYRQQSGSFRTVDDLARVKGIGPSKLAQLRDLVRV
jgi:competence protein ComEA